MLRVGLVGAAGRMGTAIQAALVDAPDLTLTARIGSGDSLDGLAGCDVAVDVTRPDAVAATVCWCLDHDLPLVIGTSGVGQALLAEIAATATERGIGVLVVPNFAVGAVLLMRFAAQAARFYPSVEIVELHHPGKADAPSGTARRTAQLVAAAHRDAGLAPAPDATDPAASLPGARGAAVEGVPVHAVRLSGLVAHQEVLLGGPGETLTLRHDSTDRTSFMPGVLLALRSVRARPGLTVGLEPLLGL